MINELFQCLNCNVIFRKKKEKQICCNNICLGNYLRANKEEIFELYKTTKIQKIADKFNTSYVSIYKIIKQNSILTTKANLKNKKRTNPITTDNFIKIAKDLGLIK